jgi:DNA-binding PadR family transcriptional regulator
MLEAVLGSTSAERVLLFLVAREEGYATEIARTFDTDLSPIQKKLDRMERDGLLVNKVVGRTRVYSINPRFAFKQELEAMVAKAIELSPVKLQETLALNRRRPRKKNKSL